MVIPHNSFATEFLELPYQINDNEYFHLYFYDSINQKLKAKSAASGEVDVEKLKQFMATQPPPPPPKVEKKNVELPEHMKEMFGRKTKSKTQEELEEEIGRSKEATKHRH